MLSLHRATGRRDWRDAGARMLERAKAGRFPQSMAHSLYKGEIGAALLAVEIEQAEDASFPLFEGPQ